MTKAVLQCPVEEAIQIIGGKWKLLVLRSLLLNGPQRYNELLGTVTNISQKELTRNLRELATARVSCRLSRNCSRGGRNCWLRGRYLTHF
jgi:DNA-binding HxlR family transcriptional regulator